MNEFFGRLLANFRAKPKNTSSILLLIIGAVMVLLSLGLSAPPEAVVLPESVALPVESEIVVEAAVATPAPTAIPLYPTDTLFIASSRTSYQEGSMQLIIPRLTLDTPVLNGTTDATLDRGVGLYEYAQLPDAGNANVSIAAHRDIRGKEFYYIHTITEGDRMYLVVGDTTYTYEYHDTIIVKADDWSPIYCKEFSALTLTSCDPIGTSRDRIIVTGALVEVSVS